MQCLKMGFFLQKVRQIELLQMSAEFVKDDCDNVWFVYANKIQYRRVYQRPKPAASIYSLDEEAEMLNELKF